ncbi:MAG TPA: hypothetical protein VLR90_22385 [Blastocatellia bacterium]|nr:hypothetical protein [Blastocatellia bacterium]
MADENPSPQEEGQWSFFEDSNDYQLLGFLQMCIEKRFHSAVQGRFQQVAGLSATNYWIHTDIGGSPKMEENDAAPNYCYAWPRNARFMGWSAHGSGCGGFENEDDDYILNALRDTLNKKLILYPEARHVGLFAKVRPGGGGIDIQVIGPFIKE